MCSVYYNFTSITKKKERTVYWFALYACMCVSSVSTSFIGGVCVCVCVKELILFIFNFIFTANKREWITVFPSVHACMVC